MSEQSTERYNVLNLRYNVVMLSKNNMNPESKLYKSIIDAENNAYEALTDRTADIVHIFSMLMVPEDYHQEFTHIETYVFKKGKVTTHQLNLF